MPGNGNPFCSDFGVIWLSDFQILAFHCIPHWIFASTNSHPICEMSYIEVFYIEGKVYWTCQCTDPLGHCLNVWLVVRIKKFFCLLFNAPVPCPTPLLIVPCFVPILCSLLLAHVACPIPLFLVLFSVLFPAPLFWSLFSAPVPCPTPLFLFYCYCS